MKRLDELYFSSMLLDRRVEKLQLEQHLRIYKPIGILQKQIKERIEQLEKEIVYLKQVLGVD